MLKDLGNYCDFINKIRQADMFMNTDRSHMQFFKIMVELTEISRKRSVGYGHNSSRVL